MTVILENPLAAHQIRLFTAPDTRQHHSGSAALIAMSCTCRRVRRPGRAQHAVIEARPRFPAGEAIAAWQAWHEREGMVP